MTEHKFYKAKNQVKKHGHCLAPIQLPKRYCHHWNKTVVQLILQFVTSSSINENVAYGTIVDTKMNISMPKVIRLLGASEFVRLCQNYILEHG